MAVFHCTVAQALSFWPLTTEVWVCTHVISCGICVDNLAVGQVFPRFIRFSLLSIISLCLHTHVYHLGMNNIPVGGHSSEA
jgi:hypothetical protein